MPSATPAARRSGSLALWCGLLAPPLAWTLHLLLGYLLVTLACESGSPLFGALQAVLAPATLLLSVGAGIAALLARSGDREEGPVAAERRAFMATLGALMSGLFTLLILAGALPRLALGPC